MTPVLSPSEWHKRYQQQARWTAGLRDYLFPQLGLSEAKRILEVGCGTGALLAELPSRTAARLYGIDIQPAYLYEARRTVPTAILAQGDAASLPYPDAIYDAALCHYLLLWLIDPLQAVREMKRVTRPGGWVLALAEPDYGGRIDYPQEMAEIGRWQAQALKTQGVNLTIGRSLKSSFHRAGLVEVLAGILGGEWGRPSPPQERQMEWQVLLADLSSLPNPPGQEEIERLYQLSEMAWESGERILFVPTFYCIGKVSDT